MRKLLWCILVITLHAGGTGGFCGLLISEMASGIPGGDWVELCLNDRGDVSMDISTLYVTMYYGTNEPLAASPVTLYSRDDPATPWDDRYVVVYLTAGNLPDETDTAGDLNGNGIRELYCNNYANSLWNTDCVAAIDTDDDPANGGIIDFVAYSNRDGSLHSSIGSYVDAAVRHGAWTTSTPGPEASMVDIGSNGLSEFQSIIRNGTRDTNTMEDLSVTPFQTPGKPNMPARPGASAEKLFSPARKKISMVPSVPGLDSAPLQLLVYRPCSIRYRVFTSTGRLIHSSPLQEDVMPGIRTFHWEPRRSSVITGLYIVTVEASAKSLNQVENIFIIMDSRK